MLNMKTKFMSIVLIILVISIFVTGCSKKTVENDPNDPIIDNEVVADTPQEEIDQGTAIVNTVDEELNSDEVDTDLNNLESDLDNW
jgi:hypothetical protein